MPSERSPLTFREIVSLLYFFDKFGTQLVIKLQAQTNSNYGRPETLRFFRAWRCLFSIEIARFVRPEHEENSLA